jgi:photosystem II stability/assembly factor-like uncharacterized protein
MPVPDIFVDKDSVVFIQEDGPGSTYAAMPCHAIDSTSIGRSDVVRVYCKDPGRRGERIIARTVAGRKEDGTLTITAWSQHQSDLLHRIWQANCMFGAQTHLDVCGLPTDPEAYTKILDYYGIMPGTLDMANVDNIEGGEGVGLQVSLSCTYADLIEVVKVALSEVATVGVAATAFTCVYGDLTERCASDCGADQDRCDTIIVGSDNAAGVPPVVWYSNDAGANWTGCAVSPYAGINLSISTCLILGDRWMVFLGAPDAALAANCSYSDLDGAAGSWTIVDMGGTATASYILNSYVHDSGNIFACGGRAGPLGGVHHSHDMGVTWTYVELATAQLARDVASSDGDTVWVVGDANMVERSTDGGHTFTALAAGPSSGTGLTAVRAFTPDHVIVGGVLDGNSEQLWYTLNGTDAAPTWTAIPFDGSTAAGTQVWSLSIVPQAFRQHIWMVQGLTALTSSRHCFRSLDGGITWELWTDLANQGYTDIFACDSNHAWISEEDNPGNGGVFYASPV